MKRISISAIILLFVVVNNVKSDSMPNPEALEFITNVNLCKNETGATLEDEADLYNRVQPITKPAKCFNACVMSKLGIVNDNKLVPANLIKIVEMDKAVLKGKDGKTLTESMNEIIAECKDVADADKCEFAAKLRSCLNGVAKKREFCPNVF